MKKNLCFLIMVSFCMSCFSQEIRELKSTFPEYQGVVTTNASADNLYAKAKLWIAENFRSANSVIQLDSPETSTIVVKGIYLYDQGKITEMRAHFTLKIEGKDNRFRYTITITDMRAGTKDISGYSMYAKDPEGRYATKFNEQFIPQIQGWMKGIANSAVNSSVEEDW